MADAETTSRSPSPSMSAAATLIAPSATVVIMVEFQAPSPVEPSFLYQVILSSENDAERTSMSPSPSTSAASMDDVPVFPSASVAIECAVQDPTAGVPSFSYQEMAGS